MAVQTRRDDVANQNRVKDFLDDGQETGGLSEGVPAIMRLEVRVFKIKGISPLLQNNPTEFIGKEGEEGLQIGKKKYNDEDEARLRIYKDADGNYCHPCESFTKALVKAARGKKFGKNSAPNLIMAGVFPAEPSCKILDAKGKPMKKYSIDRRGVVIGKSRVLRCRPCWSGWTMQVPLEIDMNILNEKSVKEVLRLAGRFPGIGDYRPEKGGAFGRFEVVD